MNRLIKKVAIGLYKSIPSKLVKREIRKKVIFSNRLSKIFLKEEKSFCGYAISDTKENTQNINYLEKKIIIDLYISNDKPNLRKIYDLLDEININFDLNININNNDLKLEKFKKILYLNKLMINQKINYDNYKYYVRIDESTFDEYDKYIINNSVQLLNTYEKTKISFSVKYKEDQPTFAQREYEKTIDIPDKILLLYNSSYKTYEASNFIINLSKVSRKYISIMNNESFSNVFFHKVIDLVYNQSVQYQERKYTYQDKAYFKYLNEKEYERIVDKYDTLSYDIFDTLICRKIYNPDDIFYKLEELTNVKDYKKYRKQAELNARNVYNCDVNIYQIYDELQKLLKLSSKQKMKYLKYEIDLELSLCYPREKMLSSIKKLKKYKKIILVSDMYLPRTVIEKILIKCGYKNLYDKLYVSNEYNARKDDGKLFDIVLNDYDYKTMIHIGDNRHSDGKMPIIKKIDSLIISTYKSFANNLIINNYGESVTYGLIINKLLFNSPFINDLNNFNIYSLEDFGYAIFGHIFLKFITWINNNPTDEEYLFVSREGYFLLKLFRFYSKLTKSKMIKSHYFLTSRRAITVPNFSTKDDIIKLLDIKYSGTLKKLFFYRLGYNYTGKDENVELPREKEKIAKLVEEKEQEILKISEKEMTNYRKYIDKTLKDLQKKNYCIIDLGYSGTVQYFLSKMLDKKISGKYFIVSADVKPLKIGCKVESCLNDKVEDKNNANNYIYLNALILEAFLTAPEGQLRCFDDTGNPIFNEKTLTTKDLEKLNQIYLGVTHYLEEIYELLQDGVRKYENNTNNIVEIYKMFFQIKNHLPREFYEIFKIEDMYCGNDNFIIMRN